MSSVHIQPTGKRLPVKMLDPELDKQRKMDGTFLNRLVLENLLHYLQPAASDC